MISKPIYGLAIDWETSGFSLPNFAEKHQGISFGAIVFDFATYSPIDAIYKEIVFDETRYLWEDKAEKIHGLSRQYLKENGVSQQEAAIELGNLVIKYFSDTDIILLGHRVAFDEAFTDQLMNSIDIKLPFHDVKIDTASLGLFAYGIPKSDDLFKHVGLPVRAQHNALEDVAYALQTAQHIKSFIR